MATQSLQPLELVRGGWKTSVPEAAGQSFKRGELIYLVAGLATVVASDGVVIYGMALQDATGTTSTMIDVLEFDSSTILRGNVYHSTPASAVTARANVGIKYAVYVGSNKVHVDIEDTGNDAFVIVSLDEGEVGDIYGRCYFKVLPAVLQTEAAAT